MKKYNLSDMKNGWFVGDFVPTIYKTKDVEVAIKSYQANDREDAHYHKIATEITVITKGRVIMFGQEFKESDVIVVEPGDATDFLALTNAQTVVVKLPGVLGDKYLV